MLRSTDLVWQHGLRGAADGRHRLGLVHGLVQLVVRVGSALVRRVLVVAGQAAVHAQVVGAHGRQVGHAVVVQVQVFVRAVQLVETQRSRQGESHSHSGHDGNHIGC